MLLTLRRIQRAVVLAGLWGLVALGFAAVVRGYVMHRTHSAAVREAEEAYARGLDELAGSLVSVEELKKKPEARVELLKDRLGYARPNDTPIVVQIEESPE